MWFCDWLNVSQQHDANLPDFLGGRVLSLQGHCGFGRKKLADLSSGEIMDTWAIDGDASVDYDVPKFAIHGGSYETNIFIRMVGGLLEVRGNPSSWGRLDNVFGYGLDDCIEIYNQILDSLGLPPFTVGQVCKVWSQRNQKFEEVYTGAKITKCDYTTNLAVGSGRVRDYHRWLAQQKLYRNSGDDESAERFARWDYSTVYTSESKYWLQAKHYDKSEALQSRSLPEYEKKLKVAERQGKITKSQMWQLYADAEHYLTMLACWCAEVGLSRAEYSFRSRWFAQSDGLGWWQPGQTESALLGVVLGEMDKIAKRAVVHQEDDHMNLSDREFRVFKSWESGQDVKADLTKATFYRLRAAILQKTGRDIATRPVIGATASARPVFFQVRPLSLRDVPSWYQRPSVQALAAA